MTQLNSGSIALLGFNGTGVNDFSFVLMTDVEAGTTIYFTDVGVIGGQFGDGYQLGHEGVVAWTASTSYAAGTVVNFVDDAGEFSTPSVNVGLGLFDLMDDGTGAHSAPFAADDGGDQLIAFQADLNGSSLDNVNFLFSIQSNSTAFQETGDLAGPDDDPTDPNQSGVPDGLVEGETALALGSGSGVEDAVSNLVYTGITTGTRADLLAAIADPLNWDTPAGAATQATTNFTVTDAATNADPVITAPAADTATEDTLLSVAGVSIADTEGDTVTVILNANGTLTVTDSGTVSGNGSSTVSITGTVTEVNTALAGLTYLPAEDFNGTDDIVIQAFDNPLSFVSQTLTVTVNAVDDAPRLENLETALSFTTGELLTGPQSLFEAPAVSDPDTASLNGGQVIISHVGGGLASEQLTLGDTLATPEVGDPFGIDVVGSDVFYSDGSGARIQIGTIDATNNGSNGNDLVIDLISAFGSMAGVSEIIRAIQYEDIMPGVGSRTLSLTVSHPDGGSGFVTSTAVETVIDITAGNVAPVLADLETSIDIDPGVAATPQVVDATVTLSDVDSDNFDGGELRVELGALRDPAGETLSFADAGGITISGTTVSFSGNVIGTISSNGADGAALVVDLSSANATPAAVEALIEALRFSTTAASPEAARTVTVTVSDGDGATSEPQELTINIVTPMVPDLTVTHTEGDPATQIDDEAQITVADPGGETFTTLTVSFTGGEVPAEDELEVNTGVDGVVFSSPYYIVTPEGGSAAYFTVSGGSAGAPLVLTQVLLTTATPAHIELLASAIGYNNSGGDTPTDGDRTVSFDVMQSVSGPFNVGSFTVNVDPVEDAPVLTGLTASQDLLFGNVSFGPVQLDADVTVTDVDTTDFNGGTLTVANRAGGLSGDDLSIVDVGLITVVGSTISYSGSAVATVSGGRDGADLVVTFTGSPTSLAAVEAIAEAVHYATSNPDPALSRVFSYTIDDGEGGTSDIAQTTVNITGAGANQPPELTDIETAVVMNRSDLLDGPQAVDADVTLADSDSSDFNGGWLRISYDDPRAGSENQLSLVSLGGGLAIDGGLVFLGSDQIGTLDSDGSNGAAIEINFTSPLATPAVVELLIEALHYQNTSLTPDTAVVLLVEVNDGDGETSDAAQVSISVNADGTGVDDAVTGFEDVPVVIAFADLLANDPGFDGSATITAVSGAVNGVVTIVGTNVVFTPTAEYSGPASFSYTASDGISTDSATVTLTIDPVNDAPTVSLTQVITTINENTDTSSRIKVADIVITDDALGTNDLALTGADAGLFEIIGTELFLRAGVSLNFESLDSFDVSVTVDDTTVGSTPDDTAVVSLSVNDINEAPSAVSLTQVITDIDENTDTSSRIKVADITITDDALGTNDLALIGADAGLFEIIGTELFLRAGVSLDFETLASFDVSVTVDDTTVGSTPDDTAVVSLVVNNLDDPVTGAPAILGTAEETEILTADTSGIGEEDGIAPGSVSLQWLRDGVAIAGATGTSYALVAADVGAEITLSYGHTDGLGNVITLTSAATDTVEATDQTLPGSSGADALDGGAGDDSLSGGDGDDTLRGGDGDDSLDGGSGSNRLNGNDGNDAITSGSDSTGDEIYGGAGDDTVTGGPGDDTIYGQEGHDVLGGGAGADVLRGQEGNDALAGGAQQDSLFGGDGNDFLNGGFAFDVLNGGAGADRFYHAGSVDHGTDWIQDYASTEGDVLIFDIAGATADDFSLELSHAIGAGGERAGDDAIEELYVIYNPTGQRIWALVDGADQDEILLRVAGTGDTFDLLA